MTDRLVEIEKLSRRFGNTQALEDIDFTADRGCVYGLVGANGAGKTTLIKHILGLLRAQSGSVRVFGKDPVHYPEQVLQNIGYLSEAREMPEWMSVDELMRYTHAYHPNWDQGFAEELLRDFALDPAKKIKQLSRGMRAQIALIAAVAHRPRLLVLDEPSSGLDAVVRKDILNAVVRTISEEGRTVIFSSHLLEEVERMSDHVTMIEAGRIVLDSRLEQIADSHHCCTVRFTEHQDSVPAFEFSLSVEGSGRSWQVIHETTEDHFAAIVASGNGELVTSRRATLEEIFVARAGRSRAALEQGQTPS